MVLMGSFNHPHHSLQDSDDEQYSQSTVDSSTAPRASTGSKRNRKPTPNFPLVSSETVAKAVLQVVLSALNQALDDTIWLVDSLTQEVQRDTLG